MWLTPSLRVLRMQRNKPSLVIVPTTAGAVSAGMELKLANSAREEYGSTSTLTRNSLVVFYANHLAREKWTRHRGCICVCSYLSSHAVAPLIYGFTRQWTVKVRHCSCCPHMLLRWYRCGCTALMHSSAVSVRPVQEVPHSEQKQETFGCFDVQYEGFWVEMQH